MRKGIVLLILSMFLCSLVLYGCGESAGEAIRKFTFRSPKVAPSDTARLPTATSASGCPPCDCPSATTGNCCCIATEFNDQHGMGEKYWTTRGDCQKDGSGYCSPAGESRTTCTGASTALSTAAASRPDIECCCVATEFNDAHLPGEKYWVATSTCTVQGSGYCAPGVSARSGCTQQLMASGVSIPRDCCCVATEFNDQHLPGEKYWTAVSNCTRQGSGYCAPSVTSERSCTGTLMVAAASRPDPECCCVATEFNDAHLPGEKYWVKSTACTAQGSGYCAPGVTTKTGCTQQLMVAGVSIPRDCCCVATEFNDQHAMGEKYWTAVAKCQEGGSGYCSPSGETSTTCNPTTSPTLKTYTTITYK